MKIFLYFLAFIFSLQAQAAKKKTTETMIPKYPIVLVHGATMGRVKLEVGPWDFGDYFRNIPNYYRKLGAQVFVPSLSTDASFEERGRVLADFIRREVANRKVNIIAHSMGGLDARYLVGKLRFPGVASITTIGSPHHGTPMANYARWAAESKGIWYNLFKTMGYDLSRRRFISELTTDYMTKVFNVEVPDNPEVKYFSVIAHGEPWWWNTSPLMWGTYLYTRWGDGTDNGIKNDGFVPITSQVWGEVVGVFALDHLAQMNHHSMRWPLEDQSIKMYRQIFDNLVRRGL